MKALGSLITIIGVLALVGQFLPAAAGSGPEAPLNVRLGSIFAAVFILLVGIAISAKKPKSTE